MPARAKLEGAHIGALLVLHQAGRDSRGGQMWRVRCVCGAEEIYPQRRLGQQRARSPVRACTKCEAPACLICGKQLPARTTKRTCSPECHRARTREIQREAARRLSRDPVRRARMLELRRRRWRLRIEVDPGLALACNAARRRRARAARTDPAIVDRLRLRSREHYAANAARIQLARRNRAAALPETTLAQIADAQLEYQRRHQRRVHQARIADPEAHRAYLDQMAEYRRRRALLRFQIDSNILRSMTDDA